MEALESRGSVVALSLGAEHAAAALASGEGFAWGSGEYGQLGLALASRRTAALQPGEQRYDLSDKATPRPLRELVSKAQRVIGVACGERHSLLLSDHGAVWGTGDASSGALGIGTSSSLVAVPTRVEALFGLPVMQLAAGEAHSLAVTAGGVVYAWGRNKRGQLGIGSATSKEALPRRVTLPEGASARTSAAGGSHSVIVSTCGTVYAMGDNRIGALGISRNAGEMQVRPTRVHAVDDLATGRALACACGTAHSLVLFEGGRVISWGANEVGQCGQGDDGNNAELAEPGVVRLPHAAISIAAGGDTSSAIVSESAALHEPPAPNFYDAAGLTQSLCVAASTGGVVASLKRLESSLGTLEVYNGSLRTQNAADNQAASAAEPEAAGLWAIDSRGAEEAYNAICRAHSGGSRVLSQAAQKALAALSRGARATNGMAWSAERVRLLPLVLQSPAIRGSSLEARVLLQDCARIYSQIPRGLKEELVQVWRGYSTELLVSRLIRPIRAHITHAVKAARPTGAQLAPPSAWGANGASDGVPGLAELLRSLYRAAVGEVPPGEFAIPELVGAVDLNLDFLELLKPTPTTAQLPPFCFSSMPFLLDPVAKRQIICFAALLKMSHAESGRTFTYSIKVRRECLLQDGAKALLSASHDELAKPLRVTFVGEEGVDQGGLLKEFFQLMVMALLNDSVVFVYSESSRAVWPAPLLTPPEGENKGGGLNSVSEGIADEPAESDVSLRRVEDVGNGAFVQQNDDQGKFLASLGLDAFRLLGRLLSLAVHNGVTIGLRFPPVMYRLLLLACRDASSAAPKSSRLWAAAAETFDLASVKYSVDELEGVDKRLADTLRVVESYSGDLADLDLYFQTGEGVELYPGGAQEVVTEENRHEFVRRYTKWVLRDSVRGPLSALCGAFAELVAGPAAAILTPADLEVIICGESQLDFSELERSARYEGGYGTNTSIVRAFWRLVHARPLEWQRRLLTFVTSSARAPLGGLGKLGLTVQRAGPDTERLPTASTCFHVLLLPEYDTPEKLATKLDAALAHAHGFGNE